MIRMSTSDIPSTNRVYQHDYTLGCFSLSVFLSLLEMDEMCGRISELESGIDSQSDSIGERVWIDFFLPLGLTDKESAEIEEMSMGFDFLLFLGCFDLEWDNE